MSLEIGQLVADQSGDVGIVYCIDLHDDWTETHVQFVDGTKESYSDGYAMRELVPIRLTKWEVAEASK